VLRNKEDFPDEVTALLERVRCMKDNRLGASRFVYIKALRPELIERIREKKKAHVDRAWKNEA
jgi:hypothetical protein